MLRLTMVEEPAPPPPETPEAARAAAIAAMGYRLAAAGPRTRQRLLDRQAEPEDSGEVIFTVSPAMLRRLAVLGTAAACSFGLVLAAQGRDWSFLHSTAVNSLVIAEKEQAPVETQSPTPLPLNAPPTLTAAATPVADHPQRLAAADPPTTPKALPAPEAQLRTKTPARPAGRELALAARPAPRQVAAKAEPAAPRLADSAPRAPHPASVARYELPRWLTDYHPQRKRVLVMSEPPHDLTPPPSAEHQASAPEPAPKLAPAAAPEPARLQFASAAPAPRPMPALRQPYGYGYGYGYGGPYAYGPVYYPYAPPPPYYSGHW